MFRKERFRFESFFFSHKDFLALYLATTRIMTTVRSLVHISGTTVDTTDTVRTDTLGSSSGGVTAVALSVQQKRLPQATNIDFANNIATI